MLLPRALGDGPKRVEAPPLENVFQLRDDLFSGSAPDDDRGLAAIAKLGVKTIISVDGLEPNSAGAKTLGMRYIHLPFGYDGVPGERATQLARVRQLVPGPYYLHCHHGKHRGPAAAAIFIRATDATCSLDDALAMLKIAGTDPKYRGLYDSVRAFKPPLQEALDAIQSLPESSPVADLTASMVAIDATYDELKRLRAAKWQGTRAELTPAELALQHVEHFRELRRLKSVTAMPEGFLMLVDDGLALAEALESSCDERPIETDAANQAFDRVTQNCKTCHEQFRDNKNDHANTKK